MKVFLTDKQFYYVPFRPIRAAGFWGYITQFLHHPNQIRGLLRVLPLPSRKFNEMKIPVEITWEFSAVLPSSNLQTWVKPHPPRPKASVSARFMQLNCMCRDDANTVWDFKRGFLRPVFKPKKEVSLLNDGDSVLIPNSFDRYDRRHASR